MNWEINIADTAKKNLKRFPLKDRTKILITLNELVFNPYRGDVEKMEGEKSSWRRRVGAYRIFFDIDKSNKIISVTNIKRRTSSTY